jgi:protein tyrosine phosphatase
LVVLEVFVEMENPFKKRIQENLDKNIIKQQLGYLNRLCWNDRVIESPMSQCATTSRLHPSFVDGYGTRKNFIIIQQPNEQTVAKFWKLIVTEEVTHILFLKKVNKKISLWPHRNVGSTGIILVRFLEETRKSYGTINYLHVRRFNKTTGQIIYDTNICLFILKNWNEQKQSPNSVDNFLEITLEFNKLSKGQEPCLIACNDGICASGLFVVISYVLNKYEMELKIDVCNAIRTARRSGTQFIHNSKQLRMVYTYILSYLHNHANYQHVEE